MQRAWFFCAALSAQLALASPILSTNPAIPANMHITTFATGVNYPYGLCMLPDGSLLAATSRPSAGGSSPFASDTQILRYLDVDGNGIADGPPTVAYDNGPFGPTTGLAGVGNIIAFASGTGTGSQIQIMRAEANGTLTPLNSITFQQDGDWWHNSHTVAMRAVNGQPNTYELLFSVGSQNNDTPSTLDVPVTNLINTTLKAESVYQLRFDVNGNTVTAGALTQIANGLRNPFGIGYAPNGDIYIAENGMDIFPGQNQLSSDELNRVTAAQVGTTVVNFGFPNHYIQAYTGIEVSSGGTLPILAFLPQGGIRSEGVAGLSLAPTGFPSTLNTGVFVAFHGVGNTGGLNNNENPLIYVDLSTNQYFHFLEGQQQGLAHIDSLYASSNALFIADFDTVGTLDTLGSGAIYRISADPVADTPEPGTAALLLGGLCAVLLVRRNW